MAKVDLASGEIEKTVNTDCNKCVHLVTCESGKQRYKNASGVNCRSFEEAEKGGADKPKVTCLNCKYLEITLPYGECSRQLRIVNPDDTCEFAEPKEKGGVADTNVGNIHEKGGAE